jgi:hypothetical protein
VRSTPDLAKLLSEGEHLGFEHCVIANQALAKITKNDRIKLHAVDHLRQLMKIFPEVANR